MLQMEHSAILLTFIKLQFVIKIFVLSIFEWPFYTGLPVSLLNQILQTFFLVKWLKGLLSRVFSFEFREKSCKSK